MVACWPGQEEVGLDLVAVAAAVFVLGHVAGIGQVGDDGVGVAFGDVQGGGDVAQPYPGVAGDGQQDPGVAGQQCPVLHGRKSNNTGNELLVFYFQRRLRAEPGETPADGGL